VKLSDNVPPWVRERRQPTRAELAGKHEADGGGMAPPPPDQTTSAFFNGDDDTGEVIVKRYRHK
jgi:hypothetical protein